MKRFLMCSVVALVTLYGAFAQNSVLKPSQLVDEAKKNMKIKTIDLLRIANSASRSNIPKDIQNYTLLDINRTSLKEFIQTKSPFIQLSIPQSGRDDLHLELVEVNPFAEGFSVIAAPSMQKVVVPQGKHYRGIIRGQDKSIVALSVFQNEMMVMISHPAASGNLVMGKLENSDQMILYQDHQIAPFFNLDCQTKDQATPYTTEELRGVHGSARSLTDCVRLYWEVDHDIFLNKGSVANVNSFVTGIFNQMATLYTAEQINTVISEIVVWTTPSPYSSTSSLGMLNAFTAFRQGFNGDLAQLISYQASGGIAYVDGLCRSNPDFSMSFSSIQSTFQNVPTYSWTVMVCAHEFGHLFGSQHTHACAWNGNNTAIDGCYTVEGSCANPGLPPNGGTIMSYCHLTNVGINFNNGFGPQPGNVMRAKVTNAACLQACSGGGGGGSGGGGQCTSNVLSLEVRTDNYPNETTWNIKNANNVVIYSGGPYSVPNALNTISLCLPTGCNYTFTINDSYGDGICCSYGNGFYNIKRNGTVVINGGQFGSSETKSFCATAVSNPSCTDGVQNGTETGVDCGGSCPACPSCTDGIKNGNETGVDCGGSCPACSTCTDGIKNGNETGVDCGGSCPPCNNPTCTDGIQNGNETGIDCGGSCPPCNNNGNVQVTNIAGHYFESGWDGWLDGGIDCARVSTTSSPEGSFSIRLRDDSADQSAMTSPVYNLSTFDSVTVEFKFLASSFETGEDFWLQYFNGSTYVTVKTYVVNTDFSNNVQHTRKVKINGPLSSGARFRFRSDASDDSDIVYIDAVVIKAYKTVGGSSCTDGIKNGLETGVDCGGPVCPACPTCTDGIKNGNETGVDCGGSCPPCSSCSDGIQNGNETGIDCGGSCPACPTCSDGIKNGNETGVDCGGSCPPCNNGGSTNIAGHYFETGWDNWTDGGSDCFRFQGFPSPEGNFSIRLRDNSGEQSAMTSPTFNLQSFNQITIQYKFYAVGMEAGEDFSLQYFNGVTWVNVATLVSGNHFVNNQLYTLNATLNGPFSSTSRFKFQCDASENDDEVFMDAIVITAFTGNNLLGVDRWSIVEEKNPSGNVRLEKDIYLYPNPVGEWLNISSMDEIGQIKVFNTSGQMMPCTISEDNHQVDTSLLPAGMYIIKVETEDKIYTKKIVKN